MISESGLLWAPGIMKFSLKKGYVFGVQTASGARDCEISLKSGMFSESGFP